MLVYKTHLTHKWFVVFSLSFVVSTVEQTFRNMKCINDIDLPKTLQKTHFVNSIHMYFEII